MISDVFIKRPVTAIMVSLALVLIGTLALLNLPVSQYPDISPPVVQVSGSFTGADAQTVEQSVVTPIETQINGTPGMAYLKSNATSDGRLTTDVTFEVGTDLNIATLDVQNRVSVAEPALPDEVRRLGLTVKKRNPTILMVVGIFSPKKSHDIRFLDNYANINLRDALLRVPGVGDVTSIGQDFSLRVWLQPDRLAQLGLTAADVTDALREQNVQVAAGSVGSTPQYSAQAFEYTVSLNGRLSEPEEFGNIVVRTTPADGSLVHLRDVARLELGQFDYARASTINGQPATLLLVNQTPGSNALDTADGIIKTLEELKASFPPDVDYVVPYETVTVVRVSIAEVIETLIIALLLVTVVVFIFLQSWRATLIPVLAIPVAIIGTFIAFVPLGFTVNTLTLFGFVLAIGIVVDDAIVVVEAVQQSLDSGEQITVREATQQAMKEITAPVIAVALVLAAVFVPVGFIPGITGRLYQQFAITIAISVVISAFVALSLTPALCTLLLRPTAQGAEGEAGPAKGIGRVFAAFNRWFDRTAGAYTSGVRRLIGATPVVLLVLVGVYAATFFLFRSKPTGFIPNEDQGLAFVSVELPPGASSVRTRAVMKRMGEIMDHGFPAIDNYTGIGGLNAINFSFNSSSGTFFVQLQPWDEREADSLKLDAIVGRMQQAFASIPEARVVVVAPPAIPGLGNTGGFSFQLEQRQNTGGIKDFEAVVNKFAGAINQRPEIGFAYTFFNAQTPGYQITVNREQTKRLGVPLTNVFNTVSTLLGSSYINDFTKYGRNFRVVAQADTAFRADIAHVGNYYVRNQQGQNVPLNALISAKVVENAPLITHYNLFRSAEFNGDAKPGYSSGQALTALQEVARETLPAEYGFDFSALSREELAAGNSTLVIFALALVMVYMVLGALYESWSVPFAILLSVPLGIFGAIGALTLLPGLTNNVYAQIGMITLIGLAAKNAILIVEYAKERVDAGRPLLDATLEAVRLRLRPIIMTSLAFILGVLPLAFASGAGAASRQTIGWTVAAGMLAATLLAIFVVPVLYVAITRLAYGKTGLAKLQQPRSPNVPDAPTTPA